MIKAIITDFDGTLVNTFLANYYAYQEAFNNVGLTLTEEDYKNCFGLRFDSFMNKLNIHNVEIKNQIKEHKKECYSSYFQFLVPNKALIELINSFKLMGGKTAIASTARYENLINVINYLKLQDYFNLILSGIDIKNSKPHPDIYLKAMNILNVNPNETLIFEDSKIGLQAAEKSGANYIKITLE